MSLSPQSLSSRATALVWLFLGLTALVAYWGHWRGEFVYDDVSQIQGNALLRTGSGTWQALGRDVWAFKGERAEAWSNYWRPTFVGWLALNYRLFGLESPAGWHWSSLTLHWLACGLGFMLLQRAGLGWPPALVAAAVFAVHPAHVESVGWISGAPDPLMACLLLASLLVLPPTGDPRLSARWVGCLVLYSLALLTKEVSVLAPVLVVALDGARESSFRPLLPKCRRAAPFAALAVMFVAARRFVLGTQEVEVPWEVGPLDLALTTPSILAFYLRQAVAPFELSPSYPLRVYDASQATALGWLGLLVSLVACGGALWLARRHHLLLLALALFVLPLLPALNIGAFHPEQLVHDRYLYLPLLGAWAAIGLGVHSGLRRAKRSLRQATMALAVTFVLVLAVQTQRYLPVWQSAGSLWQRAVTVDPQGAFSWALYGQALANEGDLEAAASALDRSIELFASPLALLERADLAIGRGRLEEARRDLATVVAVQPQNAAAVERLAMVLQRGGALAEAAAVLEAGRRRVAHRYCSFTANLGIIRYLQGDKAAALSELESIRGGIGPSSQPSCQLGLFNLASLYAESGRTAEATTALEQFLVATEGASDGTVVDRRRQAIERLAP